MTRPITNFTGQWADMPLAKLAEKAAGWGYSESRSRETVTYRGI